MANRDFKLIIITPWKDAAGELGYIHELFDSGMQLLHIRKPAYSLDEMKSLLIKIPPNFHSKIVIHNHYELINEFELKGIHLPEKVRKEDDIKKIKRIVSTSFHTLEDIITLQLNFEYAFFGPVFQSISKDGYKPAVDLKTLEFFLKSNKNQIKFPVMALGGITDENILEVENMGFRGAACIGYIWENSNPVSQFKKLQQILPH